MRESEVKDGIKKILKPVGWMWIDTETPSRTYKQLKDVPDLILFRRNHVVLMEVKSPTGKPTEGQLKWMFEIGPHLGENVHHMFIYHPDELPMWMTIPHDENESLG